MTRAPDLDAIAALAAQALGDLPAEFREKLGGVAIRVDDFPDEDVVREMGLESPFDLLGLYSGAPLGQKDGFGTPETPDMIFLYRRPILDEWAEGGEDLAHLVRHVLIHEIGHHWGLSDADMEAIEAAAGDPG